jgi:hypothetical protein
LIVPVPAFDETFTEETMGRMRRIAEESKPLWGVMNPGQMRAHLMTAIRYSLGKEPPSPPEGSWFLRTILAPLLINGWLKMPKNVDRPKLYDVQPPSADIDALQAEMMEFLEKYGEGRLDPPPHPSLGDLGPNGWAKLHAVHIDHHLRQFGV